MIGNNSEQLCHIVMTLASMADRLASVYSFDVNRMGQFADVDAEICPTLGTFRICHFIMTIQSNEVSIRVGVHLKVF